MTSYQKLKCKCAKLQAQVDIFKDALTIVRRFNPVNISFTDRQTLSYTEQIAIQRNKIIDERIKLELQRWVAENLDKETIFSLLRIKEREKLNKLL